jgi:hypothetical protein
MSTCVQFGVYANPNPNSNTSSTFAATPPVLPSDFNISWTFSNVGSVQFYSDSACSSSFATSATNTITVGNALAHWNNNNIQLFMRVSGGTGSSVSFAFSGVNTPWITQAMSLNIVPNVVQVHDVDASALVNNSQNLNPSSTTCHKIDLMGFPEGINAFANLAVGNMVAGNNVQPNLKVFSTTGCTGVALVPDQTGGNMNFYTNIPLNYNSPYSSFWVEDATVENLMISISDPSNLAQPASLQLNFTNIGPPSAANTVFTYNARSVSSNGSFTVLPSTVIPISFQLMDANNNMITTGTTPVSCNSTPTGGESAGTLSTVTNNNNGSYSMNFTTGPNNSTITCNINGISAPINLQVLSANNTTITLSAGTLMTSGLTSTATITPMDTLGNPINDPTLGLSLVFNGTNLGNCLVSSGSATYQAGGTYTETFTYTPFGTNSSTQCPSTYPYSGSVLPYYNGTALGTGAALAVGP